MTRRDAYHMMQTLNRGEYEMGGVTRHDYEHTELALAVDWDGDAARRWSQAQVIREERRAERRLRDAVLVVECRHCRNFVDIPALDFDATRGHLCASCERQAVMA